MSWALAGSAIWDFLKKIPSWVFLVIGTLVLGKIYLESEKDKARKREREKAEAETKEVVHTIEREARADADAAIEARDNAPVYGSADSLPDEVSKRVFRDTGS